MAVDSKSQAGPSGVTSQNVDLRRRAERRAWQFSSVVVPLVGAMVVGGSALFVLRAHWLAMDRPVEVEPFTVVDAIEPLREAIQSFTADPEPVPEISQEAKQQATVRLKRVSVMLSIAEASKQLSALHAQHTIWVELRAATLTGVTGRRIAANDSYVAQFEALCEIADQQTDAELAERLSQIVTGVDAAQEVQELADLDEDVQKLGSEIGDRIGTLATCELALAELEVSATTLPPADHTLADVLTNRSASIAADRQALTDAATGEATKSIQNELQQLSEAKNVLIASSLALAEQLKLMRSGRPVTATASGNANSPAPTHAQYRAELALIRSLLTPFISPGYAHPLPSGEFDYRQVKQSMSYAAIVDAGALEDSAQGREILYQIGGWKSAERKNDRPLGAFPKMQSAADLQRPEVLSKIRDAQRLLRHYHEFLVADHLLTP